jgi:hypothetical protein
MTQNQTEILPKNEKIIIRWLAHHDLQREDFENHVFYLFNYAFCIGCFSFAFGVCITLILGNLFYYQIINFLSFPIALLIFLVGWIPSIFQYAIQITRKTPLKNRMIKFLIRFIYPVGSIIFIFKIPLLGFALAIPAGYLIVIIRKIKNKRLME